uniref:ATP synthase F1 subunit 4 n=1 Tax=Symphyocladia marchantioides TaxID=88360 RepID=UPI0022FD9E57|nr:ATP synthase F1 subunit 4 [Symphyocladia marchantioides]WAX04046.1 ATP synthase F1 subunit 4 [Symphyocladia marchantioides]
MKFSFTFIILFVFIITNKLFLFNEEFLILLSFISFCFVIYEQLGKIFNSRFESKIVSFKNSFLLSIDSISEKLNVKKKLNVTIIESNKSFNLLKNYYLNFSTKFLNEFIIYLNNKEKINFSNKLICLHRLETEYFKLIVLLLFKKIKIINLLTNFFGNNLQLKRFQTLNLINKLIIIKKI